MDQILCGRSNLPSASDRCGVAENKNQEWRTSGVSDRATYIRVASQRPPKCHQCDNAAFRRRRQDGLSTLTGRPLQCPELVGKLGPPYQFHQNAITSLLVELLHINYPLSLEGRTIPCRSKTLLKTWAFSWTISFHPKPIEERLPPRQNTCCLC